MGDTCLQNAFKFAFFYLELWMIALWSLLFPPNCALWQYLKSQSSNLQVISFTPWHNLALYKQSARVPSLSWKNTTVCYTLFLRFRRETQDISLLFQSHQRRISQISKPFQTTQFGDNFDTGALAIATTFKSPRPHPAGLAFIQLKC